MPVIARFDDGVTLVFVFDDHNPPHIHGNKAELNGSFNIRSGQMTKGNLSTDTQKEISEWISLHIDELLELWETQDVEGFNA